MGLLYLVDFRESELRRLYSSPWNWAKNEQTQSQLMTLRFLAVQLFAALAIALASDFLPPGTPRANTMEARQALM
jgi:hypothetical protein